jgi:hypothetical protein
VLIPQRRHGENFSANTATWGQGTTSRNATSLMHYEGIVPQLRSASWEKKSDHLVAVNCRPRLRSPFK